MKNLKLPKTDSIQKLAAFWGAHDLTDFEDELEEVAEPVFVRGAAIKVPLKMREAEAVERLARASGISREQLVRSWVLQRIARRNIAMSIPGPLARGRAQGNARTRPAIRHDSQNTNRSTSRPRK